jgi:hypothetical protein
MYYKLENRTDKEVGNVFPQVSCFNQKLAHSIKFDEFSNFDTEILFELSPKAKLTDVLSQATISSHGLLINQKVKDLFVGFTIMEHRYYKCIVKDQKGITHNYYWLHIVKDLTDAINYNLSTFYYTQSGFKKGAINLKSYTHYLDQKKENGILWGVKIDKISLNKSIDIFDLISCIPFEMGIYISPLLNVHLQENKISGIECNKALNFI